MDAADELFGGALVEAGAVSEVLGGVIDAPLQPVNKSAAITDMVACMLRDFVEYDIVVPVLVHLGGGRL